MPVADLDFDAMVAAYLADTFEHWPSLASSLGLIDSDDRLEDHHEAWLLAGHDRFDRWYTAFAGVDPTDLTIDQGVDRDLILAALRRRQLLRPWRAHRRNPIAYMDLHAVADLFINRLRPDNELVEAAVARMAVMSAALDNGMRQLDASLASALTVDRGIRRCRSAAQFFRAQLPRQVSDPGLAARLAERGELVADHLDRYRAFLTDLVSRAAGDWAIGDELYTAVLREAELVDHDTDSLLELGRHHYDQLTAKEARLIDRHGDPRSGYAQLEPFNSMAEKLDWTAGRVEAARQLVQAKKLLTLPAAERCAVEAIPDHQRPLVAAASYRRAPALAGERPGVFYMPGPQPDDTGPDRFGRPAGWDSTIVHETYPGHHAHYRRLKDNPRLVRHIHTSSFFSEGWGVYAEQLMHQHGFFDTPIEELSHLRTLRLRAARVVIDVSLHTKKMAFDEAVGFMSQLGYLPNTCRLEVERYCSNPIQAVSYLVGALAIHELTSAHQADTLRVHDALTAAGALPLPLAERALAQRPTEVERPPDTRG